MTPHVKRVHDINSVTSKKELRELISDCALDTTDEQILYLRYVKRKNLDYIADEVGLAYSTTSRRHRAALKKLMIKRKPFSSK